MATNIDPSRLVILGRMAKTRTLPAGEEGIDWIWDKRLCAPLIKKTCETCGSEAFLRKRAKYCSRKCSSATLADRRRSYTGEDNPKWRGGDASYVARHIRVRSARGKASEHICSCGKQAKEWAHAHDTDPFNVDNYVAMCVKCHRAYDAPFTLKGDNHPRRKLTSDDVKSIREQYATGSKTQNELATDFGITQGAVNKIVTRKVWKEVVP